MTDARPDVADPIPEAHLAALELVAATLGRAENEPAPDAFYSGLCETVCEVTRMRRALIFRYDELLREVRVVGTHNIDPELFAGARVNLESAPLAARAVREDRVIEVTGGFEAELPLAYVPLAEASRVCCTPMAAAGRQVGVILSDRPAEAPALTDAERSLLWIFGKLAALAAITGTAVRQSERARQLEHRLALARELHERVVQRLFGVSLALSSEGELDRAARDRSAAELSQAAADLREALQRSDLRPSVPGRTLPNELARLAQDNPELGIDATGVEPIEVPAALEPLLQSVLRESIRNAHKHSSPTRVEVRLGRAHGALTLEVQNDGVPEEPRAAIPGMGLRLAAFDALEHGGFIECGARGGGTWLVKLVVAEPV